MKIRYTKWIEVVLEFDVNDEEEISEIAGDVEVLAMNDEILSMDYYTLEGSGVIESLDEAGNVLPETVPFDEGTQL